MVYNLRNRKIASDRSDSVVSRTAPATLKKTKKTKEDSTQHVRKSSSEIRKHDKLTDLKDLLPFSLASKLSSYKINEVNDMSEKNVDDLWAKLKIDCGCVNKSDEQKLYGWLQLLSYIATTPVKSQKKTKLSPDAWSMGGKGAKTGGASDKSVDKAAARGQPRKRDSIAGRNGMERKSEDKDIRSRSVKVSGASPKLNALISARVPDAVIEHKKDIRRAELLTTKEHLTELPTGKNLALHHVIEDSNMLREAKRRLHHESFSGKRKMSDRFDISEFPRRASPLQPTMKVKQGVADQRRQGGRFGSTYLDSSDLRSPKSMLKGSSYLSVPGEDQRKDDWDVNRRTSRKGDSGDSRLGEEHHHTWDPVKRASIRESVNWPSLLSPNKPWSDKSHDMMTGTHHSHPMAEKLSQSSKTSSQPTSAKGSGRSSLRM